MLWHGVSYASNFKFGMEWNGIGSFVQGRKGKEQEQ